MVATKSAHSGRIRDRSVYDSASLRRPTLTALGDLYRFRSLVVLLVRRDMTVRYKRSLLGVGWTILNPVLTSLVLWLVFYAIFHSQINADVPFIIYVLSGILLVTYFQQGVTLTGISVTTNASVLTKVYVPPVIFPVAAAAFGAMTMLLGLIPLAGLQVAFGVGVPWTIALTPLLVIFVFGFVCGIGLIVGAFASQYGDVLDLTAVFAILMGYATPTFYPVSIIPARYRELYFINPLPSFVQGFRWLEYGSSVPSLLQFMAIILGGAITFAVGLSVFTRRWPRVAALL